jgi:hypothetical protein
MSKMSLNRENVSTLLCSWNQTLSTTHTKCDVHKLNHGLLTAYKMHTGLAFPSTFLGGNE